MKIDELLKVMVERNISDIHFKVGAPPTIRVYGKLTVTSFEKFTDKHVEELTGSFLSPEQKEKFMAGEELDLSYTVEGISRFRINVYRQKGGPALSLRAVPLNVKTVQELNLPVEVMERFAKEARGLILFAGVTGAGKTTTMNSLIRYLNETRSYRIVTIEDPIEYHHQDIQSSFIQREVGLDTRSFQAALKHVLRQDPDVVVIGEMRDYETMSAGITAAETGHLVLSTIHTMDATQTVDRIIDAYPSHQQTQARQQLANVLKGVIAQRLLPTREGQGRVPATEVLLVTSLIRKHILEGKTSELQKVMEQGSFYGMHIFDQDIVRLVKEKKIDQEEALANATNPDDLMLRLRGIGVGMSA